MPTTQQPAPTTDDDVIRTATYEACIGSHWLQFYDDGHMEIVDQENYLSGNLHGEEYIKLTPAELTALKNHLCTS